MTVKVDVSYDEVPCESFKQGDLVELLVESIESSPLIIMVTNVHYPRFDGICMNVGEGISLGDKLNYINMISCKKFIGSITLTSGV